LNEDLGDLDNGEMNNGTDFEWKFRKLNRAILKHLKKGKGYETRASILKRIQSLQKEDTEMLAKRIASNPYENDCASLLSECVGIKDLVC
jgi:uncharacterized protein YegP (UPF0339 family)